MILDIISLHAGEHAEKVNWLIDPLWHFVSCESIEEKITCNTEFYSYLLAPVTFLSMIGFVAGYFITRKVKK